MMLRNFLIVPTMLCIVTLKAQTGSFDKVNVRSSLKLQDKTITDISTDTLLSSVSDSKLPTERAVKKYIDNTPSIVRKAGGGIRQKGDSLYLGGIYSAIYLDHEDGQSYLYHTGDYFAAQTVNSDNGYYSRITMGSGGTAIENYSGLSRFQLSLYEDEFSFSNGFSTKFRVDRNGVTNVESLQVMYQMAFSTMLIPIIGEQADLAGYGTTVNVLDELTGNTTLILPDPTTVIGRVYYLFNANTSTVFNYTINYPIYKSGSVSYTSIPGNTEFRAMIISDGTKWIQLN